MARKAYKRAKKKATLADKVKKIEKLVVSNKPETKYIRSYAAPYMYQAGTLIRPLASITQGLTGNTRLGDAIKLKSFNFRSYVEVSSAVAFANVRFILFQYKSNPDAVVSTDSTIINLLMESGIHNTTYFPVAFYDWANRGTFRVLKDTGPIMINHNGPASTPTAKEININYTFKNSNNDVEYVPSGTTVTKNDLMLLCISNFASSSVTNLYNYQLTFTD